MIGLIKLCSKQLLTPCELFLQHQLPSKILIIRECLTIVVYQFSKITSPDRQQVDWLLRCLEEMSQEQQIKAVESLLTLVDPQVGTKHSELIDWLR